MSRLNTTLLVKKEARQLLRKLGRKGQSYDEVIAELAKEKEASLK
jgi:hypothetical protein